MSRNVPAGILAALATELLYGVSFVFTKSGLDSVDPVSLLAWRFGIALAAMLLLIATRVIRLRITSDVVRPLLVLAILQPVIYYAAEAYGIGRTTASETGLIISAIPVFTLLGAWLILGVTPSRWQSTGILITFVGVCTTVVVGGLQAGFNVAGYLALLLAVVAYSLYAVFAERLHHARDIDKTFVMVASGAIVFGGVAVVQHLAAGTLPEFLALPATNAPFRWAVVYLGIGPTVGAFFFQNVAIRHLGSNGYATFIGLSTLVALAAGALVLGERLAPGQFAGGALILAGVYVANHRGQYRPRASRQAGSAPLQAPAGEGTPLQSGV